MPRLENLYTHLIENRRHELQGWYDEYESFCNDIETIRANLGAHTIRDVACYADTQFEGEANPFETFITKLLYERSNGISSRGQSILSQNNLQKFITTPGFEDIIKDLVRTPNFATFTAFKTWWAAQGVGNNPVLQNRALAACTADMCSTVDERKFNQLFYWLENEGIIVPYPPGEPQDWYHKNVYMVGQLRPQLAGIDKYWTNIFLWEMYVNITNPFSLKKQIVKYGSPGTGKTFTAERNAKLLFDIWKDEFAPAGAFTFERHKETVQFHPSYTYEDFIEGLRPKLDAAGKAQLSLQNGIFKDFCIEAGRWERDVFQRLAAAGLPSWQDLRISDLEAHQAALADDYWQPIFAVADKTKKVFDAVPPYFFIIDEINRAELSRVFGELMYCLEYRGVGKTIKTQYAQLNDAVTGMISIAGSYRFFIPNNVYILGTMNTIDRSVESFDFALRRRFRWEEVMPDVDLLTYHLTDYNAAWKGLAGNMKKLNDAIKNEVSLGRDFQIGHAYLWNLPYSKELTIKEVREAVWEDSIEPLLQEYLRGSGKNELLKSFKSSFGIS